MCGRFVVYIPLDRFIKLFGLKPPADWPARYNVAPTQLVPAIRKSPKGPRQLDLLRWGLVPSWSKDLSSRLINARSETVKEKPSFRSAFRHRRCIIVASGFYEWEKVDKKKIPYYVHMANGDPMPFAGIWETWTSPKGEIIETCAILTTSANELVAKLHDRMPVILPRESFDLWLNPQIADPEVFKPLFAPYPAEQLAMYPVSTLVNKPANDSPACIDPV